MPMAEVFTISGATDWLGALGPMDQATGQAPVASPPVLLQNALKALGTMAGDPKLSKLTVDGVIGPNTVKAVNYSIAKYIGATQYFPKPNLTLDKVRQYAGGLAGIVTDHIKKRGGSVPPPVVAKRRPSGGTSTAMLAPELPEPSAGPSKLVWFAIGGAALVVALGFMAAKRRRALAAA